MRNLLGRLHARPPADLARIAAFWQVPVTGSPGVRDRHALIGPLFRAMTDPRAVRAVWDRLAPAERDLVRLLAGGGLGEAAPTLAELAVRLGVDEAPARETAARLYRVGILAREGGDEPLPVGEPPRLGLPRDLASLFRAVEEDVELGDQSGAPLPALVGLLGDAEVEEAAGIWGVPVVPGLREREEVVRRLLRQVGDPERVARVAADRRRDAARLWRRVRDEPDGAPVPLATAAADVGLAGDDPRTGQRLREALAELETALLVWHTYRPDGSRWLFVPAEIRDPRPPAAAPLPPLAPIAAPAPEPPPWRHPDALAWDLLTLLREVADPTAPPWPAAADPPRDRLRRLNRRLWHRGDDLPPAGYVGFLAALGVAEGLLAAVAERGDDHGHAHAPLATTPAARGWRDRTFAAQTDRLRRRWLADTDWSEGRGQDAVEVWGADWHGARRRLLALLADPALGMDAGVWYALDPLAARVAARDPELLGGTFTAATARHATEEEGRAAAIADVVSVELETAFAWFGLVEVAAIPGHTHAVRLTPTGLAVARFPEATPEPPPPPGTAPGAPPLVVTEAGEVELREPSPLRVWALSAFADPARLDHTSQYRLSAQGLRRALAAGFDLDQVTTFLSRQGGAPVPPSVADRLADWAHGYRRVRLRRAVLLAPDDAASLPELARLAAEAGLTARPLGDDALLVEPPSDATADDPDEAVAALLLAHGYAPRWTAPPAVPDTTVSPAPGKPVAG